MKKINNKAFSLLEVLLAAIIFILSISGIFATLNAVRTPVGSKELALTAAVFGKQVLEALRSHVDQHAVADYNTCGTLNANGTCADFALSVMQHQVSVATLATYGLVWPTTLTGFNGAATATPAAAFSPVLVYTVACADGSAAPCTTPDIAHKVVLNINWS